MGFIPRLFPAALCASALAFSALSFSAFPASAQSGEPKPPAEQPAAQTNPPADAKNVKKTDELAEAAAALTGPAGNAECVWLGRRVVSLLWRDDLDTAFRHLDLYDRFGCPASHIQASFRCVVRMGPFESKPAEGAKPADGKPQENRAPENLNSRVHACWIDPGDAKTQDAPAPTMGNPVKR